MNLKNRIIPCMAAMLACMLFSCAVALAQDDIPPDMLKPELLADMVYYDAVKARQMGDEKQAEELFLRFLKQKPNTAAAYYELSRINIKNGSEEKAVEYIKKAIKLDDDNKWYQLQYAEILAAENQFEEAAAIYDGVAQKERFNEDYLLKAASFYKLAGKYTKALELIDKLLLRTGQDEDILIFKQQLYLKMNDVANAAKVMEQLIARNPKEAKYYAWLAEIYDNNNLSPKAAEVLERAQKMFPGDASIQIGLAGHYKKQNDTARHNQFIRQAITNKDLDIETQLSLLIPYLDNINNDSVAGVEGLQLMSVIMDLHPGNSKALAFYGDMLIRNNEREKGLELIKKSIAIDPSSFIVWNNLLQNLSDKKNADSLIKYSEKAIRLFPNQASVHFFNGIGHFNLKNYNPAIKSLNRAIDLQPEENVQLLTLMYSTLGDIYNLTKQYALSDSCLGKALNLQPNNASTLNNYAYYLSERNEKLDDAERMSKRSLEIRPGEATFFDTYGWVLYKKGQFEKAKEYVQKAVDANPANADGTLFDHLGDIYFKLNERDKAIENWKKAKEKGADNLLLDKKILEGKLYE